jgi:hypothetical protein
MAHADNISQAELARQIARRLDASFDRSKVQKLLVGSRDMSAEELLVIEDITGFPAPLARDSSFVPLVAWSDAAKLSNPGWKLPAGNVRMPFFDLGAGDFFATKVEGDAMDRYSPEGSIIVANKAERELIHDRSYVFSLKGETIYRIWQGGEHPYLATHSTAPSIPPIFFKKGDLEVVGRVKRSVFEL